MTGFTDGQTIRLSGDMVETVCAVSSKPSSRIASRACIVHTNRLHTSLTAIRPTTWNSLSADLRDPTCSDESFRRSLKTFLFSKY